MLFRSNSRQSLASAKATAGRLKVLLVTTIALSRWYMRRVDTACRFAPQMYVCADESKRTKAISIYLFLSIVVWFITNFHINLISD